MIFIAQSGGVDSSVCTYLINKESASSGVTLIMHDAQQTGADSAGALCASLGISHYSVDVKSSFNKLVVAPFVADYLNALTPNPCVLCNFAVKFPLLFAFGDKLDKNALYATGHYAQIAKYGGSLCIKKALDEKKDQSYVLWRLTEQTLSRLRFPLGGYTKNEIREIARSAGFECASSPDSQDICFIPDGDYGAFIERYTGTKCEPGNYVLSDKSLAGGRSCGTCESARFDDISTEPCDDVSGRHCDDVIGQHCDAVIGRHRGHYHYTIGQRRGLGIALGKYMYVIKKDALTNTVTLGSDSELYKSVVKAGSINLFCGDYLERERALSAKIRYGRTETTAMIQQTGADELTARFSSPVRAPAPGQSLVVYDGGCVVGGGIIK